jgi:predicted ATP-grasp superfamily ATP-dependent carboligase
MIRDMQAIILDGHLKSALITVRSLGAAGIKVLVGSERKTGMALHSVFTEKAFVYPSPYTAQKEFIHAVKEQALQCSEKPVIFSFSDATYLSLYAFRDMLEDSAILVFPNQKSVEIAFDKAATYSLARVSGVPTINTYMPATHEEVRRLGREAKFPLVIKTRRSVTWNGDCGIFGSASFVHNTNELEDRYAGLQRMLGEPPLVQDFIQGEEYGVEMLAHEGHVYAQVTHHRLRSLSPTGGASVLKETLEESKLKETLETYAKVFVQKLAWSGPIMIEFKVDSDSMTPYLMEINGRFWGSLPLSVAAGVDMPKLFFTYASTGTFPTHLQTGRSGVVTNHFLGDIKHLLAVFFQKNKMREILFPSRQKALQDFFMKPPHTQSDIWSWSDPVPAVMEIVDVLIKSR